MSCAKCDDLVYSRFIQLSIQLSRFHSKPRATHKQPLLHTHTHNTALTQGALSGLDVVVVVKWKSAENMINALFCVCNRVALMAGFVLKTHFINTERLEARKHRGPSLSPNRHKFLFCQSHSRRYSLAAPHTACHALPCQAYL